MLFPVLVAVLVVMEGPGGVGVVIIAEQLLPSWALVSPLSHSSQTVLLDWEQFTQPSTWQTGPDHKNESVLEICYPLIINTHQQTDLLHVSFSS